MKTIQTQLQVTFNSDLGTLALWSITEVDAKESLLPLWKSKPTNLLEWIYSISLTKPAWDSIPLCIMPYAWIIPASLNGLVQKQDASWKRIQLLVTPTHCVGCLISTITGHLRTRFADIFLEDVLSKNIVFKLEGGLEDKLEGGIGGIGKERRGMKCAIAGGNGETKTNCWKRVKQGQHATQSKSISRKK